MEILTYPIGLVVGLLPVIANLGGPSQLPARLLLDGRPACTLTAEAPRCDVDLGRDLHVHLLELVRTDARGNVLERAVRWVNRPGSQAEVYLRGSWDRHGNCTVDVGWGHPQKLEPTAMSVTVNGRTALETVQHEYRFRADGDQAPVVTVDLTFPDGRQASTTRALGGGFVGSAEAELHAVPITLEEGAAAPSTIGGFPVRTAEDAPVEVAFVVEPGALDAISRPVGVEVAKRLGIRLRWPDKASAAAGRGSFFVGRVSAVVPNRPLEMFDVVPDRRRDMFGLVPRVDWLRGLRHPASVLGNRPMRLADAVALAAFSTASRPSRRAVILVISGAHDEKSEFTVEQARTYLSEIMVPLLVWRQRPGIGKEWPDGPRVSNADMPATAAQLRAVLNAQRIAWVEGDFNPATLVPGDGETGFTIAGRETTPKQMTRPATAGVKP